MDELRLDGRNVQYVIDPAGGTVCARRVGRAGARACPWVVDLGAARLTAGRQSAPVRLSDLALARPTPERVQWVGAVRGAAVALEIELEGDDLLFTVTPLGTGRTQVEEATWPGEVRCRGTAREVCWSDAAQGALFRADGEPWRGEVSWDHAAMRVFGLTGDGESVAVIVETPYDAHAHFEDDGAGELRARVEFGASLGHLAYARRVRLVPLERSGHVAVADAFRAWAQQHGLWRSWEARVDENPAVARLQGCFVACAGYYHDEGADQVAALRRMRALGFERGYVFSPRLLKFGRAWDELAQANRLSDTAIAAIEALGYITAPFLQVEEADESIGWERLATGPDGEPIERWRIGDTRFYEIAKWRVRGMLGELEAEAGGCSGVHFDTLTAMALLEHWGEGAYDRRGDVAHRLEIARHYRSRGKVIGSESLRDWGTEVCDLNTSKRFTPIVPGDARAWTVPLTDLVYHDALIRTIWEHWAYDDARCIRDIVTWRYHPFGQVLMDLLTCSPPVLFPEGMLYQYATQITTDADGREVMTVDRAQAQLYRKRFSDPATQAALPKALRACRLHATHGRARMARHRFLEPARAEVQESEFASGLRVVVNFGDEPYGLEDGRTVPGRSAVVDD